MKLLLILVVITVMVGCSHGEEPSSSESPAVATSESPSETSTESPTEATSKAPYLFGRVVTVAVNIAERIQKTAFDRTSAQNWNQNWSIVTTMEQIEIVYPLNAKELILRRGETPVALRSMLMPFRVIPIADLES